MPFNFVFLIDNNENNRPYLMFEPFPQPVVSDDEIAARSYYVFFDHDDDISISERPDRDVYKFSISNIEIRVFRDDGNNIIDIITKDIHIDGDTCSHNTKNDLRAAIKQFLVDRKARKARKVGREISSLKELGESRRLPENMESVIGSYLSGKRGSLHGQVDKLKQNTGVRLAPRPGGGSKTRKRRS